MIGMAVPRCSDLTDQTSAGASIGVLGPKTGWWRASVVAEPIKDGFGDGGNDRHHNAGAKGVADRLHESGVKPPEHKKLKAFLGDFIDHQMAQWGDNSCQHPHEQGNTYS